MEPERIVRRYHELKRFCPNHTLLDLIKVENGEIALTEGFGIVYKPTGEINIFDEYFIDLGRALEVEHEIHELRRPST